MLPTFHHFRPMSSLKSMHYRQEKTLTAADMTVVNKRGQLLPASAEHLRLNRFHQETDHIRFVGSKIPIALTMEEDDSPGLGSD